MQLSKLIIAAIITIAAGLYIVITNTKEKSDYTKSEGTIEYLALEYDRHPHNNHGKYRYLKIDTYPYVFEIYEPNSIQTEHTIDDLKVGDKIDIYYYEITDTREIGLNRFTQFIDSNGLPYFIRNGFMKNAGYVVSVLGVGLAILGLILKKKGIIKN